MSQSPREAGESDEQDRVLVEQLLSGDEKDEPLVDRASSTRYGCIAAIAMGMIISLSSLASGIYILASSRETSDELLAITRPLGLTVSISPSGQEALTLAVNIVLALCTDGMMFVHSVSLRWALYREQLLEYNTNLRLFTSSKEFGPNKWYINMIALGCLILTYAASSVLFLQIEGAYIPRLGGIEAATKILVNATALVALGLGLIGQALIAAWCLVSNDKLIPTWSSNPLNTALVVLQKGDVRHRPGRCMQSVHQRHVQGQPTNPIKCQGNMFRVQPMVRYILVVMWALAVLAILWPIGLAYSLKAKAQSCWRPNFEWFPNFDVCSPNVVSLSLSPLDNFTGSKQLPDSSKAVLGILFVFAIQGGQTIILHCLELLVNLSRDEGIWRQAHRGTKKAPGIQRAINPLRAAVSSWENIVQFISKAVFHWIIGQGLVPSYTYSTSFTFPMMYSRLVVYAILAVLLAIFGTYLAFKQPRGYQPATLGHIQTLVDLVDDWKTDDNGRMWWGDKTGSEDCEVRHAGTCCEKEKLGPIRTGTKYAGV